MTAIDSTFLLPLLGSYPIQQPAVHITFGFVMLIFFIFLVFLLFLVFLFFVIFFVLLGMVVIFFCLLGVVVILILEICEMQVSCNMIEERAIFIIHI